MADKKDELINIIGYMFQCLTDYKSILESGDCNTCAVSSECKYKPRLGELVRFNCMFYEKANNIHVEEGNN